MPCPSSSLVLPPLALSPNGMPSNPRDSELPSTASDPIRIPFLDCTFETCNPVVNTNSPGRFGVGKLKHHSTSRSLSEGSSRCGRMHVLSYNNWRAGLRHREPKDEHTTFHSDSRISSLLSDLHIHFEQPFDCQEPRLHYSTDAAVFSSQFAEGHQLNADFVKAYQLQDELGCGGYGFVMTALDRIERQEVAVKFIIKAKVPDHAWMEDEAYGRLPTEVVLLSCINHENIVKCLGLFEDDLYFYMVSCLIYFVVRRSNFL